MKRNTNTYPHNVLVSKLLGPNYLKISALCLIWQKEVIVCLTISFVNIQIMFFYGAQLSTLILGAIGDEECVKIDTGIQFGFLCNQGLILSE